jgi:hypothetical protein
LTTAAKIINSGFIAAETEAVSEIARDCGKILFFATSVISIISTKYSIFILKKQGAKIHKKFIPQYFFYFFSFLSGKKL